MSFLFPSDENLRTRIQYKIDSTWEIQNKESANKSGNRTKMKIRMIGADNHFLPWRLS
jgi:hypothetical protein